MYLSIYATLHILRNGSFLPVANPGRISVSRYKTRTPNAVPTLVCQGQSFYLKFLVKKGVTPKL